MQRLIEQYGIPQDIVEIWRREEGDQLLDVQSLAIEKFGLLEGTSLLISAPSSSGKTFVGELAAIASYYKGKKTIFLVPMKAIAEEKYIDFKRKYQTFGIRVAISTHDRTLSDESILAGYFDIAIIIFEKMNSLITQNPAVLNSCGLVVVDELQLLNDPARGSELEILLTKIKLIKEEEPEQFQFLGLSAVLGDLNRFDEWLGARHCCTKTRPLELHEGVLSTDGRLRVRNFNNSIEFQEAIPMIASIKVPDGVPQSRMDGQVLEESIVERLVVLCKHYLGMGKRVLIFRKWRNLTRETAQRLTQRLSSPAATEAIQALADVESTNSREALIRCLGVGIAFHNSDLSAEERLIVENEFRDIKGQIQVVCSTSTLAMGVNLPASVTIIADTLKPDPKAELFHEVPVTAAEYKNMAGRAGRTRFKEEGISVLLSNSIAESTRYWQQYVKGRLDKLAPALTNNDLRKVLLSVFASGLCNSVEEAQEFLLASYTGFMHWNNSAKLREPFLQTVQKVCGDLEKQDLLKRTEEAGLAATPLGLLCAASGVNVNSFIMLRQMLDRIDVTNWHVWEVLFPCLHCRELADILRIQIKIPYPSEVWMALEKLDPQHRESLCAWSARVADGPDGVVKRVQASLMLHDWINGREMVQIENQYTAPGRDRILSGGVRSIAENVAWMVQTLCRIAAALKYDTEFVEALHILSERVARGVQEEGIALHRLGVQGVTRTTIRRLIEAGYGSLDKILDTPAGDFRGIVSPRIAQRIHEEIVKGLHESQERRKHSQAHRLERKGYDPRVVRALYEVDGIPLEHAIVELLNSHPLELGAERIEKQRDGEPDIRLVLKEGFLVASVTASQSNISDKKCTQIIASGARMNPNSYAVFGRPGFHELAIRNAPDINRQLEPSKSFKLIPIHELGELFVRVVEGNLSRDLFVNILMNHRGLFLTKSIEGI